MAGTLPFSNSVETLEVIPLSTDPFAGEALGGATIKALLKITYKRQAEGLHTSLFCKLPHVYTPQNERYKISCVYWQDGPEIMFNRVMSACVPFRVPKYYFGDFCSQTTNFILISEALEYNKTIQDRYPPFTICAHSLKYRYYELPEDGVNYYFCHTRALAKFTADYQNGRLGDKRKLSEIFMGLEPTLDGYVKPIGWTDEPAIWKRPEFQEFLKGQNQGTEGMGNMMMGIALDFVLNVAPQLYPDEVRDRKFITKFHADAMTCCQYTTELNLYCDRFPELQSLHHVNSQIDNAFFWYTTDEKKEFGKDMDCGLFDWGGVRGGNFFGPLGGNWNGAMPRMMEKYEEDLIRCWVETYHEHGGSSRLTFDVCYEIVKLSQSTSWIGQFSNVQLLLTYLPKKSPKWKEMPDRWCPDVNDNYVRRAFVVGVNNALEFWKSPKTNPFKVFESWRKHKLPYDGGKGPIEPLMV
eukprot:gnl/TRDRNA2_/TRDRNA2_142715_c1_seq1.p1 gnl/TRDRNA2_/TRDRNA2_142715_c1~~gnl/TRDRNA2_/TRDRNA2_142715_c1_seq1.p1  ORF type:complete len:484 (-),score=71.25 gnl/TRDRNA2_/TRDRNA2_142715_c1_seq1:81-1481(-)